MNNTTENNLVNGRFELVNRLHALIKDFGINGYVFSKPVLLHSTCCNDVLAANIYMSIYGSFIVANTCDDNREVTLITENLSIQNLKILIENIETTKLNNCELYATMLKT